MTVLTLKRFVKRMDLPSGSCMDSEREVVGYGDNDIVFGGREMKEDSCCIEVKQEGWLFLLKELHQHLEGCEKYAAEFFPPLPIESKALIDGGLASRLTSGLVSAVEKAKRIEMQLEHLHHEF